VGRLAFVEIRTNAAETSLGKRGDIELSKSRKHRRKYQKQATRLPQSQIDIVVPVYGRPDLLRECLKAVELNTLAIDYRLILVDDKSPEMAEMEPIYSSLNGPASGIFVKAQIIRHQQNQGFPMTCNDGAARGSAPAILFLNTDVVLQPGAVQAMLDTLWDDDLPPSMLAPQTGKVGVVGPMLLFPEDSTEPGRPAGKVQHAGMGFNLAGQPVHINIGWSRDNPKVTMQRGVQCVTGACMMVRRETWNGVAKAYKMAGDPTRGGFNLAYGRGTFEDIEYCFAARSNGYRVVYEPKAVGYHHVGASSALKGEPMPLQRNASIFRARCGHLMLYDQWMWY